LATRFCLAGSRFRQKLNGPKGGRNARDCGDPAPSRSTKIKCALHRPRGPRRIAYIPKLLHNPADESPAPTAFAPALPSTSTDSAVLITLPAGAYTVQVSGANGTTGNALVEIYEVSSP